MVRRPGSQEGSILFVPGIAMRKVDVATKQDGNLVVVTEDAPLVEAFKDANIKWSAPVKFSEIPQPRAVWFLRQPVLLIESFGRFKVTVYADAGGLQPVR